MAIAFHYDIQTIPLVNPRSTSILPLTGLARLDRPSNDPADDSAAQSLLETGPRFLPREFQIEALAGHRSFATQNSRDRIGNRLTVNVSNTILGVGTTMSYDAPLGETWFVSPFASIDYHRIDTTRSINTHSPIPYARNNGDTGLTGSAGATLSHTLDAGGRWRIDGYGAVEAASAVEHRDDDASVATRVVKALNTSGIESVAIEYGIGTTYQLSERLRVDSGIVRAKTATSAIIALYGQF